MLLVHLNIYLAFFTFFLTFTLPLGVGGCLRLVIVTITGLFIELFAIMKFRMKETR